MNSFPKSLTLLLSLVFAASCDTPKKESCPVVPPFQFSGKEGKKLLQSIEEVLGRAQPRCSLEVQLSEERDKELGSLEFELHSSRLEEFAGLLSQITHWEFRAYGTRLIVVDGLKDVEVCRRDITAAACKRFGGTAAGLRDYLTGQGIRLGNDDVVRVTADESGTYYVVSIAAPRRETTLSDALLMLLERLSEKKR